MTIGLVGKKAGMTRVFTEQGESIPVTVIQVEPNRVTQRKTEATDGYEAIQVTTGERKPSRLNKPTAGRYAKIGVAPGRGFWEFRLPEEGGSEFQVGDSLDLSLLEVGQLVDVRGKTKGKGFAGAIKRHHFRGQDNTHGNSLSHRAPGSIGQNQTPGRVFKGKRMAGHMGDVNRVQQNLEVVRVDKERNLLLVRGAVPGARGGDVIITPAIKQKKGG